VAFTNERQGDTEPTAWRDCEKDEWEPSHGISSNDGKTWVLLLEAPVRDCLTPRLRQPLSRAEHPSGESPAERASSQQSTAHTTGF